MPRLRTRPPRMYQDRGRAYVKLDGRRFPLGPWNAPEAQEAYDRLIAEWLASGRRLPPPTAENTPTTVTEVCVAYARHVEGRYARNKTLSIKPAIRRVRRLYGSEPAESFGPKRLRVIRSQLTDAGLARSTINEQVRWIRTMFKWAASYELVPASVHHRLQTVEPLKRGEGGREMDKVKPVPRDHIRKVRPHLGRQVRALIDLQLLTGARADELVRLRPVDLDTSAAVWTATLDEHKTRHKGKERTLYFGPRAQRIIGLFMGPGRPLDKPLFDPREANAQGKRGPGTRGRRPDQKPTPRKTDRIVAKHYTTGSYRRAIHRATDKAFPVPAKLKGEDREAWVKSHRWGPHRLRHNAGTSLRREFGLEVASIILGHSSLAITTTYAEQNEKKAIEVIAKVG